MKLKFLSIIVILLLMDFSGWAQQTQMRVCKKDGTVDVFNIEEIRKLTFAGTNGINDPKINAVMKNFSLLKTFPNPFRSSTTITYLLPGEGAVEIVIIDLNGKIIQILPGGDQCPGGHTLTWDGNTNNGKKAQSGIYFCKVKFNHQVQL